MKTATFMKIAASSLILGTAITGCSQAHMPLASASQPAQFGKAAEKSADQASKAMAKRNFGRAADLWEKAVAAAPDQASYRAMLGQTYLNMGRFTSAENALGDALTLDAGNAKAALNLALAQIANGKNDAAMRTLDNNRTLFSAADYGLAVALAGDPAGAVSVLETASRDGRADTKLRQNLALAYALAGKWNNARVMAAQDLSPDQLDARMTEWAQFVRPGAPSQQVASLLGVTPVVDAGLPSQLALARSNDAGTETAAFEAPAEAAPEPGAVVEQVALAPSAPSPAFEMAKTQAPLIMSASTPTKVRQTVVPMAKRPVVKPMAKPVDRNTAALANPALAAVMKPAVKTAAKPAMISGAKPAGKAPVAPQTQVAAAKPKMPAPKPKAKGVESGTFSVQLGAFASSERAQVAWNSAVSKSSELGKYSPATSRVKSDQVSLFRMAVTGFATREAAGQVCTRIKAKGRTCFVRAVGADAPTQWAQRAGGRIASR